MPNFQDVEIFRKFLLGKSVAILGPAPYLKGKAMGEFIDSFDVVIRINHVYVKNLEKCYGSRTDVIFHNRIVTGKQ